MINARYLITAALAALITMSADGGIHYEFHQVKSSSTPGAKPVILIGAATIDGPKSRVEVREGSSSGVGQYVVTTNGGTEYAVVNPENRSYTVRHSGEVAQGVQALGVTVRNMKIEQEYLGSGPKIAGYPTEHYKITANYDVAVNVGELSLEQHVVATIEKYTTLAFGDVAPAFFGAPPTTGNSQIDVLIEAETTKIPGFPLKQAITVVSTLDESALPQSSLIQVQPSRQRRTEMTVTAIGRVDPKPGLFRIPIEFERLDNPMQ